MSPSGRVQATENRGLIHQLAFRLEHYKKLHVLDLDGLEGEGEQQALPEVASKRQTTVLGGLSKQYFDN